MNINEQISTGNKIHSFRKRSGLSQFELEVAIEAAAGSVSRMENDQVDPSKDTLIKISKALDLVPVERAYLLGVFYEDPSPEDIAHALKQVEPILNDKFAFAYLLDHHSCILKLSTGFKLLGKTAFINTDKFIGKNVAELLFAPEYKVRSFISKEKFRDTVYGVLGVLNQERGHLLNEPWWKELINKLKTYPDFTELWEEVQKNEFNLYDYSSRTVYFKFLGKEMPMVYSFTPLSPDSRFVLVEYKPIDKHE